MAGIAGGAALAQEDKETLVVNERVTYFHSSQFCEAKYWSKR